MMRTFRSATLPLAAAKDFITRQAKAGKPFFTWWNATRMHFRTHVKKELTGISGPSGDEYHDGMVEHDRHVGELLKLIDDLGLANDTIVMYSTDNGPHYNTWPDAGTTPFHGEKNSNWEGAYRVPAFVRWPGKWLAGETLNGIVSHEDWLPTFAAAAGNDKIVEQLKAGVTLNGRRYKNHIDGHNMLDYLSGKTKESPRKEFIYSDDGGHIVAIRVGDWKSVYAENRADRLQIWKEPFIALRAPDLYNLRRDPFEKAKIGSNTYEDWYIDRAYMLGPMQVVASKFLITLKDYPPSQAPGDWSLESLEKQIKGMAGPSGN
jgi:arylsulfatase